MFHQPPHIALFYDATLPIQRRAVSGVLRYANSFGSWIVTLNESHNKPSVPHDCRGILACSPTSKELQIFMRLNIPLVLINLAKLNEDDLSVAMSIPHIRSDTSAFGIQAADFFLSRSPRTFVYVGYDSAPAWDIERGLAFAERIRSSDFEPHIYKPLDTSSSPTRNANHLKEWLKTLTKPLAIFAANDERARQVLTACQLADITVPYEAEILGVDNDEWLCESTRPRLSSIPFSSEEGGYRAAKILESLMLKREDPEFVLPSSLTGLMPPCAIVERESTNDRNINDPIVSRALAFIQFNKGLNIRVQDVANAASCTIGNLESHFRKSLNTSVINEISNLRRKTVLHLVQNTNIPFLEIAQRCGFTNASTLCRIIKKETGKTMTDLRNSHK